MTEYVTPTVRSSGNQVYHTDKDCRCIIGEVREARPNEIESRGLRECKACREHNWKHYRAAAGTTKPEPTKECPFCGTQIKRMHAHLPCEESP